ncbi:DUF222 domain-containing protein [uncultured Georgenia sp.]|uniref:HNH endonuclease signature motif containing protein n=1 Tax=uncultured Georgenia sp. TaxID=378209 RepID=UPI0026266CB0|nr:DUF222 domain-containing protein [uncultured Georgenia sp.]
MAHDGSDGAPDPLRATSAAALGRRPRTLADGVLAGVLVSGIEVFLRSHLAALDDGELLASGVDLPSPHRDLDIAIDAEFLTFGLPMYAAADPENWPERTLEELLPQEGALGEYLEHLPPGERLAKLLAAIDLDKVDTYSVVEVVAAYKRMEAWSAAKAAHAAAVLAERDELNPTWPGTVAGRTRGECVAGQELSMRLRVSKLSAIRLAACGRAFGAMFQPTGQALEAGLIDYPRAQAIVTTLQDLPAEVAMAAQWEVLPKAPGRTLRQVQHDLAKAVIAVDPDSADARHRAARQKRCVHRPRALPDGMASITAVLAAGDAIALDTTLEAAARAAKNNGDRRTLDQLRADSLALMAHTALESGHIGPCRGEGCRCGCTSPGSETRTSGPAQDVSAPDSTAADAPEVPASDSTGADAPGVPPSDSASADAPEVPSSDLAEAPSPAGGPASPPGDTATSPPPAEHDDTAAQHDDAPPSVPRFDDGPPRPSHRLPGGCLPTLKLGMLGGGRADVRITIPLDVLLPDPHAAELTAMERDPQPVAELEGYGPVPPVVARAIAAGGGVWRRLVTDPVTEQVLDVGRTRYQPPAAIADHVRERDRTCIRPGCSTPARSCDLDHEHEWQHGGETSAANMGPLCTADHRIKSIGAFAVAHGTDRTYAWTTPTGHGYLRRPDGTTVTLPRRTADGLRTAAAEATRSGRHLAPAAVDAVLAEISSGTDVGGTWAPHAAPPRSEPWPGVEDGPSWSWDDMPPF